MNAGFVDLPGNGRRVSSINETPLFAEQSEIRCETQARERKIIAVGGPKGGVGKSMFAVNLAVFLSNKGYKTVVVDLDLGGANIHFYIGKNTPPNRSINAFLKQNMNDLDRVTLRSDYGPWFIGGSNSGFGAAQIEFGKKLRLIKAIKQIAADFIILDLGGDMSFNCLDFFLCADYGIVMTTPDAASYMSSYHFMKAALYRKFQRLFGPESKYRQEKDAGLEKLLGRIAGQQGEGTGGSVEDLLEEVKKHFPAKLPLVMKAASDFTPCLLLNKVPGYNNVHYIPAMVQEVTRKWLSKETLFLGCISDQLEIEESIREQVPAISRHPHGQFAAEMAYVADKLLNHRLFS